MSLVSIVNLAERLLNQSPAQGQDSQATQGTTRVPAGAGSSRTTEDQYTPSGQNGVGQASAQAAGLFSVTQSSFFSAAADFLLGTSATRQTEQNASAASAPNSKVPSQQTGTTPAEGSGPPAATPVSADVAQTAVNGNAGTSTVGDLNTQPPAAAIPVGLTTSTAATTETAATQQQLQALNQALESLGLSVQDIQKLDQIASVINDFSPAAFTALAYQLEILAQQTTQQSPPAPGGNAQPAGANTSAVATNATSATAAAATGPASKGGGFQVQELAIKFSGVNEQAAISTAKNSDVGAHGAAGNNSAIAQISAFNLQIKEVSLTLVNTLGQTAKIQTVSQPRNTNISGSVQAAASAKTQSARA
jgi:hypothetical protein